MTPTVTTEQVGGVAVVARCGQTPRVVAAVPFSGLSFVASVSHGRQGGSDLDSALALAALDGLSSGGGIAAGHRLALTRLSHAEKGTA